MKCAQVVGHFVGVDADYADGCALLLRYSNGCQMNKEMHKINPESRVRGTAFWETAVLCSHAVCQNRTAVFTTPA